MKEGFTGSLAVAIGGLFDFDVRYFTCRNYNERFFVVVFASFGRLRKGSLVRCFFLTQSGRDVSLDLFGQGWYLW